MDSIEVYSPPVSAHKDCRTCEQHYLPEKALQDGLENRSITAWDGHDAQRYLRLLLFEAEQSYAYIRQVLRSHGDLIESRRRKFSRDKEPDCSAQQHQCCFRWWTLARGSSLIHGERKESPLTQYHS